MKYINAIKFIKIALSKIKQNKSEFISRNRQKLQIKNLDLQVTKM